jgi:hypothetical protein
MEEFGDKEVDIPFEMCPCSCPKIVRTLVWACFLNKIFAKSNHFNILLRACKKSQALR